MIELKELRALVKEMRKLGIKALSSPDVSLTLSDAAPVIQRRSFKGKEQEFEGSSDPTAAPKWDSPDLSEDQQQANALFWSSEGIS